MKKITILTSLLALTACGGGSGTSVPVAVWSDDTIITQDMLNDSRVAQSQEISKKLKTIEYVENNLGAIIKGGELTGDIEIARSATTGKIHSTGLSLADIEARYQQALGYFEILKKVLNASATTEINTKEVKIAYSLSVNKAYDEITEQDLPGIDISAEKDEVKIEINVIANIQITITNGCKENEELKESATDEIIEEIPVIQEQTPEEPKEPEESEEPEKPAGIDETKFANMVYNVADAEDLQLSFKMKNGAIDSIFIDEPGVGEIKRNGNTNSYSAEGYRYTVPRKFNMYFTWLSENPKESETGLENLKAQIQRDIDNGNCYSDCITSVQRMLNNNSFVVTKENNGSYKIEFPTESVWGEAYLSKDYVDNSGMKNSVKLQQIHYLLTRDFITEEQAEVLRNTTEELSIDSVCGGTENDCYPTLQAIAEGKGEFSTTTLGINTDVFEDAGLSYASFGSADFIIGDYTEKFLFAGGDSTKLKDKDAISQNMTFHGSAIGNAFVRDDDDDVIDSLLYTTNNATLTLDVDNKKETLVMPFDDYYDVTVEQSKADGMVNFSFENGEKVPEMYRLDSNNNNYESSMQTQYYGEDTTASEVSGTVFYEQLLDDGSVGFQGAFGMKKQ